MWKSGRLEKGRDELKREGAKVPILVRSSPEVCSSVPEFHISLVLEVGTGNLIWNSGKLEKQKQS
jgi:hypothetical protein